MGTVLIAVIPFPHDARREVSVAGVLFFALVAAAFLLPWERLPEWAWLVIPIGYIAVIAIIRDAQGGSDAGLVVVYLLPIVWLSLYGRRLHLLVGLFCMDLALLVPLLIVGPPKYPTLEWRQVAVMATVTTLVASTVYTMVSRDRVFLGDLAEQSHMARRNAREADYARDRLETLLRAATGSAIMGVDPAGTVTFFSAGAEQMLGYRAAEVVGIRSIADFIDPAQIDERRQTIDAMRNALEPVDAETAAEVPWTATRKDGEQRRCVVRVRALTLPTPDTVLEGDPADEHQGPDDVGPATAEGPAEREAALAPSNGGYVVVAIDVTEREELAADRERLYAIQKEVTQSLIEQNNRLRELTQMKDDVVATVSHELRTPITSIRGFIELLLDGPSDLTESQMRMLHTIERNSAQLQRVAEDLLADPGGGHGLRVAFTELDLHRLAEEAVHAHPDVGHRRRDRAEPRARRRGPDLRRPHPAAPAAGQPVVQRHQVLAPRRPRPRDRRHRGLLRPDAGPRRGARHPRGRARPALRALLPAGLLDGDGRARDRPGPGHRQVGRRGPRGLRRHRRHARLVDHLPGLPPAAERGAGPHRHPLGLTAACGRAARSARPHAARKPPD